MKKIKPFLWFDNQAEEAARFYISVFTGRKGAKKVSKMLGVTRYKDEESSKRTGIPEGAVMVANFTLDGQEFVALNGGPRFKFTEAISFVIDCKTQAEVDYFWERLCEGGQPSMCGWLKDKYGLSWQVVPADSIKMIQDKDPKKAKRAMEALMKMSKIDVGIMKTAMNQK